MKSHVKHQGQLRDLHVEDVASVEHCTQARVNGLEEVRVRWAELLLMDERIHQLTHVCLVLVDQRLVVCVPVHSEVLECHKLGNERLIISPSLVEGRIREAKRRSISYNVQYAERHKIKSQYLIDDLCNQSQERRLPLLVSGLRMQQLQCETGAERAL